MKEIPVNEPQRQYYFIEKAKEYVFCDVEFGVTDKFVKKYKK